MMALGVAVITCLNEKEAEGSLCGVQESVLCGAEGCTGQRLYRDCYGLAGEKIADSVQQDGHRKVLIVTNSLKFSNENEFCRGLCTTLGEKKIKFAHITTDSRRLSHSIINTLVQGDEYDAMVTTNVRFAEKAECDEKFCTGISYPDLHDVLHCLPPGGGITSAMS